MEFDNIMDDEKIREAMRLYNEDKKRCYYWYGPMSAWDTSNVTNMEGLFRYDINEDISNWDTSNVINMKRLFNGQSTFNQPIGKWNLSNVRDMSHMFAFTTSFKQDLSAWDVSNCINFNCMFYGSAMEYETVLKWKINKKASAISMFQNVEAISDLGMGII